MTSVSIRRAEPRDVPPILRVAERAWNAVYEDVLEQSTIDSAMDEWYTTTAVLEQIQNPDVVYFVAETDGAVVGYASGGMNELGTGELGAIYVDPDDWRAGIGTRLLEHFEDYGRSQGWDPVQIRVIGQNEVARAFYEKHDYEVHDTVDVPLFGEPIEEICYQKDLA